MALSMLAAATLATACGSSSPTQVITGPPPNRHGREVDTFAYTVVTNPAWVIRSGVIAAYFLETNRVSERGVVMRPPLPIVTTPRLLLDTIVVSDTLAGPPAGTDLHTPSYLTFDGGGNLWMSVAGSHGDGSVIQYSRAQTNQNGSLLPTVTLTGSHTPLGLRFDAQGNLWVVDSTATALLEYSGIELETGGPPAMTVSLAGIAAAGATWSPLQVTIDRGGNFWISALPRTLPSGAAADSVPAYIVTEFTAAAIQGGGTPTPALTLVVAGFHPGGYGPGMAFDSAANLWTANGLPGTITQFSAASLTPGANPAPAITLTGSRLQDASDIVIDSAGILYIGGGITAAPGGIFAYSPRTITASGSPTPRLSYVPGGGVNHFAIRCWVGRHSCRSLLSSGLPIDTDGQCNRCRRHECRPCRLYDRDSSDRRSLESRFPASSGCHVARSPRTGVRCYRARRTLRLPGPGMARSRTTRYRDRGTSDCR
jgi:hypothetical protein